MPNPRKRSRNSESEVENDVSPAQLNKLIQRYKIRFLKYSKPWPAEHAEIFADIKKIGREQYEDYQPTEDRDDLTVAETRQRVSEVVQAANRDYESRSNEQTLRIHTEPLIFRRFQSEVSCRKCRRQLWKAEYATKPKNPNLVERLSSSRTDAEVCRCPLVARYEGTTVEAGTTSLFADRCSAQVEHDEADALAEYPIPYRMPDRVFGLNNMQSMKHYTQQMRHLKHTPFSTSGDLVYPFLISEAKPGVQNPGFESIDAQTAFPIRSCLMLQRRLREASNMDLDPLVWYMPYQGDIWRLAACVIQEDEVHVYHLWMGCSQDPDGALQLLHIIDYIVQWARHTFRDTILACLARGWNAVQRQTPGPGIQSSRPGPRSQRPSQPLRESSETAIPSTEVDIGTTTLDTDSESDHPPSPRSTSVVDLVTCTTKTQHEAVLRQASLVKYEFVHVKLPESTKQLRTLLVDTFVDLRTAEEIKNKAWQLCHMLTSNNHCLPLNDFYISRLRRKWLKETDPVQLDFSSIKLTKTLIQLSSEFEQKTWHIVHRILCISCSASAERCLARVAERSPNISSRRLRQNDSVYFDVSQALTSVACLPSKTSTLAALRSWRVDLTIDHKKSAHRWILASHDVSALSRRSALGDSGSIHFQKHARVLSVRAKPAPSSISRLLGSDIDILGNAVLLKRPYCWPRDTPVWCLMNLETADPMDRVAVVWKIMLAIDQKQVYAILQDQNNASPTVHSINRQDVEFVESWAEMLMNKKMMLATEMTWKVLSA